MSCSYFLWRFGEASRLWTSFERLSSWLIFILWSVYVFIEKGFAVHFDDGSIVLIDLLLGIPIIIAMGLVFSIIWKGLIRGLLCLMGKMVTNDDRE
jgi:hypothetical protein